MAVAMWLDFLTLTSDDLNTYDWICRPMALSKVLCFGVVLEAYLRFSHEIYSKSEIVKAAVQRVCGGGERHVLYNRVL
jgi:hypothetical protein